MREFAIRPWFKGNPGNIAMMYMAALTLRRTLGYGELINVSIPIFDVELADRRLDGMIGLHDTMRANLASRGLLPFQAYKRIIDSSTAGFLSMEGFCQHVGNFTPRSEINYDEVLRLDDQSEHGQEDEIVISIRGGEVFDAIHKDYTMVPIDFYKFLARKTGLKPLFFGQLGNNPYCDDLRHHFPDASFIPGISARFDFNFLRRSVHIVPSVSTFSWLAAWLSDAKRIYLPLTGLINPNQHRGAFLVPRDDERYEFYLFPNNYALNVQRYRDYLDPIAGLWTRLSAAVLEQICATRSMTEKSLDAYLRIFNEREYLAMYPEKSSLHERFGICGLVNDYVNDGFSRGLLPCKLDVSWYTRTYPRAALDVASNVYHDEVHHYAEVGHNMGFLSSPPD